VLVFETASQVEAIFFEEQFMNQNWIHKNLRRNGSPVIIGTLVQSSIVMSDLCINFEKPSCNPNFGLSTKLAEGTDQRDKKI
jgi:hypothetical protein